VSEPSASAVERAWAIIDQCGHFDEAACSGCIARALDATPAPYQRQAVSEPVEAALRAFWDRFYRGHAQAHSCALDADLLATVTVLVTALVEAERERCALMAETIVNKRYGSPTVIGQLIRQAPCP
jgi:hypothetical protein